MPLPPMDPTARTLREIAASARTLADDLERAGRQIQVMMRSVADTHARLAGGHREVAAQLEALAEDMER